MQRLLHYVALYRQRLAASHRRARNRGVRARQRQRANHQRAAYSAATSARVRREAGGTTWVGGQEENHRFGFALCRARTPDGWTFSRTLHTCHLLYTRFTPTHTPTTTLPPHTHPTHRLHTTHTRLGLPTHLPHTLHRTTHTVYPAVRYTAHGGFGSPPPTPIPTTTTPHLTRVPTHTFPPHHTHTHTRGT